MVMAILVPCTKQKDRDELCGRDEEVIFTDFDNAIPKKVLAGLIQTLPDHYLPESYISELHRICDEHNITALYNTDDYLGSIYTSILSRERGYKNASLDAVLRCHHKYYARVAQQQYVADVTPQFAIVRHDYFDEALSLGFPFFIKPVKAYLSVFAKQIHSLHELKEYFRTVRVSEQFLLPFNWAIRNYTDFEFDGTYFIAEKVLEGRQVTLEGYSFEGEVGLIGIVDSFFISGTLSFERFVYPSSLSQSVQERMFHYAKEFVSAVGLDMTVFNIEYIYNEQTDELYIIEINPRMASQFCDLYAMVHGVSNYDVQYAMAKGHKPVVKTQGDFSIAASLVGRQLEDKKVLSIPTEKDLHKAQQRFPELKLYPWVKAGDKLSDVLQDGISYVYCWIHLGAQNTDQLEEKYQESKKLLPFIFTD